MPPSDSGGVSVYLYIPNIVGYIRILMNCVGFALCSSHKSLFVGLYFVRLGQIMSGSNVGMYERLGQIMLGPKRLGTICFALDGVDGWLARKFNQVSIFGAVLDMVTDRVSTACLLGLLAQIYRPGLAFLALLALDIGSHWFQMYSSFLSGKASHKDVKDSNNWLFRLYYGHRYFMAFCCVGSEVLYIILFLLADKQNESLIAVLVDLVKEKSAFLLPTALAFLGWAIKQIVNVIQMKSAADACVLYDMNRNK